ncbi:MAG: TolC family protein, partial [Planctomycetaceae bacterium]|nr:TolC family protein [Planctomycetaceae bacterium]
DMKAARFSIQAARHRLELDRKSFLRIDAVLDGNHGGAGPSNVGPGLRFEIPVFNRNEGLIIRSQWSLDQASRNYQSVRDRIITEVKTSLASVDQANSNLQLLREEVLPDLQDTIKLSEAAYRDGGDTYFLVLQSTTQYLDSRIRELELMADLRRAIAELDRSVGRRVVVEHYSEANFPLPEPSIDSDVERAPAPELLLPTSQTDPGVDSPEKTAVIVQASAGVKGVQRDNMTESLHRAAGKVSGKVDNQQNRLVAPIASQSGESANRWIEE